MRVWRGKKWTTWRYQWMGDVPLRGDEKAIQVNWFSIEIATEDGMVTYRNSFVTDLPVDKTNVAPWRRLAGRDGKSRMKPSMH